MGDEAKVDRLVLQRVRAICLPFVGADEGVLQDRPLFRVGRRRFAIFNGATSPSRPRWAEFGRSLHFLADPDEWAALDADERFRPSPHHGDRRWVAIELPSAESVDWDEVAELLDAAYRQVVGRSLSHHHGVDVDDEVLDQLRARCRRDHQAWINGDASGYALPDDGTIMGAVGGFSHGGPETADRQQAVAAQWRSGTGTVEFLDGGRSGDLAWLVFVERAIVEFADGALGAERTWDLRVTEIFRRVGDDWERLHRHADPLVSMRPLREILGPQR